MLKPELLDPESNAQTIRQPHSHNPIIISYEYEPDIKPPTNAAI